MTTIINKEWVAMSRISKEYRNGARQFVNTVQINKGNPEKIQCPCRYCLNVQFHHYHKVYEHLIMNGFDPTYKTWVFHGESPPEYVEHEDVEMPEENRMLKDAVFDDDMDDEGHDAKEPPVTVGETDFVNMVKDAELLLYMGCTYTKSPQMSLIKEQRTKKQLLAALVATDENTRQNSGIRISDEDSNSPAPNADRVERNKGPNSNTTSKNTRGKAKMIHIAKGKGSAVPVEFNWKGQPIGSNAAKLASCLGTTARELVPVTTKSFSKMNEQLLKQIWEHIKQKFDVDECRKEYIFRKMSKIWRDHRTDLVREVKKQGKTIGLNRAITLLKPDNVYSMDEWKAFIKKRSTAEYEARCEKFKKMRASQTLPHTTSRKGYARLEEEMRKKSDNPDDITRADVWVEGHQPKNGNYKNEVAKETMEKVKKLIEETPKDQNSINDDAISIVIGPERRGSIKGLGFGATKTKVKCSNFNRDKFSRLESQMKEMNDRMNQLDEILRNKQHENTCVQGSQNSGQLPKQLNVAPTPECGSNPSGVEGRKCDLLDWVTGKVVGKGEIASTDPTSCVHHVPIGKGCWKVWVLEVFDNSVSCFRPTREFFLLYEALSSTLAWPIEYIRVIES